MISAKDTEHVTYDDLVVIGNADDTSSCLSISDREKANYHHCTFIKQSGFCNDKKGSVLRSDRFVVRVNEATQSRRPRQSRVKSNS